MSIINFTIADPCHENWQNMTAVDQGRYCASCQKTVTDFSTLSDREAHAILLKGDANMCGRFAAEQLQKGIQEPIEKKQRLNKFFFGVLVPALLFTKQSPAQMGKVARIVPMQKPVVKKVIGSFADKKFELSGKLMDADTHALISNASITIKGSGGGTSVSDSGFFKFNGKTTDDTVSIVLTAIGYEHREIKIAIPVNGFIMQEETFYLKKQAIQLEAVTVHSEESKYLRDTLGSYAIGIKIKKQHRLAQRLVTVINDSIRIYPNPVRRGSSFEVALKLKQAGNYTIQVIDVAGRLVFQQTINAADKKYTGQVNSSSQWAAGIYLVRVIGPGNKMIGLSRFVAE